VTDGALFLVPSMLGDGEAAQVLPDAVLATIRGLDGFIAEEPKTARAFLKRVGMSRALADVRITTLSEHTEAAELPALLQPALDGERIGLLSEAGYPALADPGAELIALAHRLGVKVVPLVGPSALPLAWAASGLNGQSFCFHGYLPVDVAARSARIRQLEQLSRMEGSAQSFIEAPYRNNQMLASLLQACEADTRLCLATELTLATESIRTRTVREWSTATPDLHRRPTVFVLQAAPRTGVSAGEANRSGAPALPRSRRRNGGRSARRGSGGE
jgi:16S rRNA (cytidine1402-2'-O)-methyltransferase